MGYTKTPNWLLDKPNNITNAEFRVLCNIYRLTAGFHRNKYKISYSKITAMSGVKKVSPIMKSLKKKKMVSYTFENGKISEIKVLQPVHSGHRTSPLRSLVYEELKKTLEKTLKKVY